MSYFEIFGREAHPEETQGAVLSAQEGAITVPSVSKIACNKTFQAVPASCTDEESADDGSLA